MAGRDPRAVPSPAVLAADVAVVGAGPAGTAAAITLARAGLRVLAFDRARFPRDKCCGDGLTTGALRRLEELGLDPSRIPSWQPVEDVWVRSPSGREVAFPLPRGQGLYGAVASRRELDAELVALARRAGAEVLEGHALSGATIEQQPTGGDVPWVTLEIDGAGPVRARYAIGADGMWSPLRKAVGAGDEPGYLGEWHAFRQYFAGVGPEAGRLWVWFEPDLLPGYAWSFPLPDGRANVGFGVLRTKGTPTGEMAKQWGKVLARDHIQAVLGSGARPEGPHRAWPIPARLGSTRLSAAGGRVLFAGDAARAADPMTGEGIGQALETGIAAAHAIIRAGATNPARASSDYERVLRRTMVVDDRAALVLARALAHRKGARFAVWLAGRSDWTRRNFARWLFEDYPRAVLLTPGRWHRHLLSGPGAYR